MFLRVHSMACCLLCAAGLRSQSQQPVVPPHSVQQMTVTAYRIPTPVESTATSTNVLEQRQLQSMPSPALDDRLRQIPGVELYRRTSSLVANPTTQGITLRGLGSTAASRTLVLNDGVPVLDPFAGYIHWTEFPPLSVHSVELVRGAASDLYGSNALSGVIHILRPQPTSRDLQIESSGGGEGLREASMLATDSQGPWEALLNLHWLVTDGYTLVAPNLQGPVDQASNLHSQFAYSDVRRRFNSDASVFLRSSVMNEARGNGTLLQDNATRLWRYAGGTDWHRAGDWQLRLFGSKEGYRQSFSSINSARTLEILTRLERTPAQELGGSMLWTHTLGKYGIILLGSDVHDVRATDLETAIGGGVATGHTNIGVPTGYTDTTARQRQTGIFAEALYTRGPWTVSAAVRGDHAATFDGDQTAAGSQKGAGAYASTAEDVANPKLGLVRRINPHIALSASAGRAFRVPTLNELYRTGQVGQIVTQPNASLLPERALGVEAGVQFESSRGYTRLHASYFWTEVNRPIVAVTQTATINLRENLGQIRSRGVSLDWQSTPLQWLTLGGGYQLANATVTRGPIDIGNWIPEVAHNMATLLVDLRSNRWGVLHATGRVSGHQYDDDVNVYRLSGYFRLDLSAERNIGRHAVFTAGVENAFNRSIQAGRTPVLTLASPQDFSAGLRWNFHPNAISH